MPGILTTGVAYLRKISSLNNIATVGNGVPLVVAQGRLTGQTGAAASVVAYTPTVDATLLVSVEVEVTTNTSYNFNVTVTYTDAGGNSRTQDFWVTWPPNGGPGITLTNTESGVYSGFPMHIRAKANTAVTVATSGTFTTVTYNIEATIQRL